MLSPKFSKSSRPASSSSRSRKRTTATRVLISTIYFSKGNLMIIHRGGPRNLQPIQSEGSGFIVRSDGYIFTNFHVVEGADHVEVKLKDGREFPAKVVGTDEKTDIAVIKIDAKDLPVAQMGDSDAVRVGQFAFAIGAPFKLDYTFTYGVVSGKGRSKLFTNGG